MVTYKSLKDTVFWKQLLRQQKVIKQRSMGEMFLSDPNRFRDYSIKIENLGLLFDFSKQHIDHVSLNILYKAAKELQLSDRIQELYSGTSKINYTENRTVGHPLLRLPVKSAQVEQELTKMLKFADSIYSSNITDLVYLGIGGSCLGPKMVCAALDEYMDVKAEKIKIHFLANHDLSSLKKLALSLVPENTVVIISSKSFNTAETLKNAEFFKDWFGTKLSSSNYLTKFFAITSNIAKAKEFGVFLENIFSFEENIGGRYSVWSAVGLPILIKLGIGNFKKFLHGGYIIDQHFQHADIAKNIPINLGLLSVWNINFMRYSVLAVISYLDNFSEFPEYLQQLSMESNGKSVDRNNQIIGYNTGEIIFGGTGSNVQHSFMQLLHQGTSVIPVDFIVTATQEFLLANCLAQSQALMQGCEQDVAISSENFSRNKFKYCPGNRPSNTFLLEKLTPEVLGALLAIYEHKIFVQSVMWNINPFDQWGVELGKKLAANILEDCSFNTEDRLECKVGQNLEKKSCLHSSTLSLLQEYLNFKNIL